MHRHKWSVRGTTQDRYGGFWGGDGITRVLYGCTVCGKLRTKTLKGLWDVSDTTIVTDRELHLVREKQ